MYNLVLTSGRVITLAMIRERLKAVDARFGTATNITRQRLLANVNRLEAHGMSYSNQDFDVLSTALNFLDAVAPEHGLRESALRLS